MPDLNEDDELTALTKRVLIAGATHKSKNVEIYADRIQAIVIEFALKVVQRVKKKGRDWRPKKYKKDEDSEHEEEKDDDASDSDSSSS
jgi:hypothetical protein